MNSLRLKTKRLVLIIGLLIAITGLAEPKALKEGDTFPDLTKFKLEGKIPASLKDKIVIVDFWASWCLPCAQSFPVLEELYQKYKDRLIIIGVSEDEKSANMEKFLKKYPITFVTVRDTDRKLAEAVAVGTMPTSFVLDGTGKVRFMHSGFHSKESKKKYTEQIEILIKEKP